MLTLRLAMLLCHPSHSTMCTIHCNLVSFPFYTIPISSLCNLRIFHLLVIQEVKGLMKKLYFVILSRRKTHNISFGFIVHIILHGYGLHYYTRSKRVNKEIILCFTVQEEDQFLYKISGSLCSHCLPVFTWLWPVL